MRSYICVPIRIQGKTVGVSALSRDPKTKAFPEIDFEHAKTITDAASSALRSLLSFLDYSEKRSLTEEGNTAYVICNSSLKKFPEMVGLIARRVVGTKRKRMRRLLRYPRGTQRPHALRHGGCRR